MNRPRDRLVGPFSLVLAALAVEVGIAVWARYAKRGDGSIFLMYFDDGRIFRPTWWWRMLDRVSRMIGGSAA